MGEDTHSAWEQLTAAQVHLLTCQDSTLRLGDLKCGSGTAWQSQLSTAATSGFTCFLLLGQSMHLLPDIVQCPQPFPVPLVSSPDSNPKDPREELLGG